jgi:acetoacetate decarboxylase
MTENEIRDKAFAMPYTNPAYPPGPYRFVNREFLVFTYRTDPELLRKVIPAPLKMLDDPIVKFEVINMPDSTGFGNYCESGQVIPVSLNGVVGSYVHSMYLNDHPPIAGGREIWGFPKKLGEPKLEVHKDTLLGTLKYSDSTVAVGTMGYKHRALDAAAVKKSLEGPNFLLKIIPHVDGSPRICELVQYELADVIVKGAWTGPGALEFHPHALAPLADLPILEIISAVHIMTDLTLPLGRVVHDYMAKDKK